jgi:LuxR family maltose regulon positive regulatory protein
MSAAVFHAKFTVPSLPTGYQERARLDGRWPAWRTLRLITVTAGAGWGKTSFAASRARKLGRDALWYTLDDLDRDPSVLAAHLVAACGLDGPPSPPLEQLARIVGALEGRRLLVLDDVQAIAGADAARSFLGRLLRYLDPNCQLLLLARERADLREARLETRGEACHLAAADLAFTPPETRAFLDARVDGGLPDTVAARVHALTEGWPAGLEVVARALARSEGRHHAEVLERLAGCGGWFDHFVGELLADLEPSDREFLLETSLLPHLEADLCDRLLGRRDSAAVLARLATAGLFVVPVGDGSWRCHTLLREGLRRRRAATHDARTRRRAGRRAARLLARVGEPEAALLDLARDGDHQGARALAARHVDDLTASRRPETLGLALDLLPDALLRAHAPLLLVRASLGQLQGRWARAEADLRRVGRLDAGRRITGRAVARLVRLHLQRGHWDTCLRSGRRALARTRGLTAADRGEVLAAMGVAAASLGRLAAGEEHLQAALRLARRRRDPVLEGRCEYLLAANVHHVRGDLDAALAAAVRARELYQDLGRADLACHADGVVGFVLAALGREAEARGALAPAEQRARAIGYRLIAGYAGYTLGECDLLAADAAAAHERFAHARAEAVALGEEALQALSWLGTAEATWRLGAVDESAAAAACAVDLAERRGDRFVLGRALTLRGRALATRDQLASAASWRRAERLLRRLGARLELARLEILRATGRGRDAGRATVTAVAASPHACVLAQLGLSGRRPGPEIASSGLPALSVRVLGPLEIDRGGQPLVRGGWRSQRARRLFNLLVVARFDPVPRDRALESLWPDGDPARTAPNLRQAVFQLRRILDAPPGAAGAEGGRIRSDGETVALALGEGGRCDLLDFERALATARSARREGAAAREIAALQDAIERWRGPFLADTPYDREVEETAAALRQTYLGALERTLALLAAADQWPEVVRLARRGLTAEPLHEPFVDALMRGLLAGGARHEARDAYERFASRYVGELGLLPSPELKALAESVAMRPDHPDGGSDL